MHLAAINPNDLPLSAARKADLCPPFWAAFFWSKHQPDIFRNHQSQKGNHPHSQKYPTNLQYNQTYLWDLSLEEYLTVNGSR